MAVYTLLPTSPGQRLDHLLQKQGLFLHAPCGGQHRCGKCKIRAFGGVSPMTEEEQKYLTASEVEAGVRLACFATVTGPVTVFIESAENRSILSDAASVQKTDGALGSSCGVAIDIGTTTVVCALFAADGRLMGTKSQVNCQQIYGSDVISRIQHASTAGADALHLAIVRQVEEMLADLCRSCQTDRAAVKYAVATGNTTMLHFFAGLDPAGIGISPYTPQSLFDAVYTDILFGISCYIPPCISAYVGADTVCAMLYAEFSAKKGNALLVDIGTNGEMALSIHDTLICCSTAAGPAFEGGGIACGSIARPGAIVSAWPDRGGIAYETIGGKSPESICGSGVIEAISAMLKLGCLDHTGHMEEDDPRFADFFIQDERFGLSFLFPGSRVVLTQHDIRQIQLAKAAISAGAQTLIEYSGSSQAEIDVLYLCGGFGSSLDCAVAESIGLIPPGSAEKAVVLGNAALKGAAIVLLNRACREQLRSIAQSCRYIELSTDARFMKYYIEGMSFPPAMQLPSVPGTDPSAGVLRRKGGRHL